MVSSTMSRADVLHRLWQVQGQVRGIAQMVEEDRHCIDVLTQIAEAKEAMQLVAVGLLDSHMRGCVADASVVEGQDADEKVAEVTSAIERFLKS